MDNSPYRSMQFSKALSSLTRKVDIITWLQHHSIPHDIILTRPELLELVKQNKEGLIRFATDELAAQSGHKVVRLPP